MYDTLIAFHTLELIQESLLFAKKTSHNYIK